LNPSSRARRDGVFTPQRSNAVVLSLKRSAEDRRRRKTGERLPPGQRKVLEAVKDELR